MGLLKEVIKSNIYDKAISNKFKDCSGYIERFLGNGKSANVKIKNQYGSGYFLVRNALLPTENVNSKTNEYKVGDKVSLSFSGGAVSMAKITGLVQRAGALKNTNIHLSKDSLNEEYKTYPISKYKDATPLGSLKYTAIDKEVDSVIDNTINYSLTEVGLCNEIGGIKAFKNGDVKIGNANGYIIIKSDGRVFINNKEVGDILDRL